MELEIITPACDPIALNVIEVVVPGEGGVFSVHPGHTPLLSTVLSGVLIAYERPNAPRFFAVHGGFVEVKDDRVVILADTVEASDSIDRARADAARERAEERLEKPAEDTSVLRAEAALARAMSRIHAHGEEEL